MTDMTDSFSKLNVLMIGDSRTEGYSGKNKIFQRNFKNFKVFPYRSANHENILEFVESLLLQYCPDLIILLTMSKDLIEYSNESHMYEECFSFDAKRAIDNINYYTRRWLSKFKDLKVIWTLPDLPDLVQLNEAKFLTSLNKQNITYLRNQESNIFKKMKYIQQSLTEIFSTVQSATTINLRSLLYEESIEEKLLSYMSSHSHKPSLYYDGVIPNSQGNLGEKFFEKVMDILPALIADDGTKSNKNSDMDKL